MAQAQLPDRKAVEELFGKLDADDPSDGNDIIDLQELEDFMKNCELLRRQELEQQAAKDARRTPEQQEAIRNAREHMEGLDLLADIIIKDTRRIFAKYTEKDLIQKMIAMGPYGTEPEVADLFKPEENGMLSFEKIKTASDMLGPYACKLDRQFAGHGIGFSVHPHEYIFNGLPDLIDKVQEAMNEMEKYFDENQE